MGVRNAATGLAQSFTVPSCLILERMSNLTQRHAPLDPIRALQGLTRTPIESGRKYGSKRASSVIRPL
jgi:hypothetical protein